MPRRKQVVRKVVRYEVELWDWTRGGWLSGRTDFTIRYWVENINNIRSLANKAVRQWCKKYRFKVECSRDGLCKVKGQLPYLELERAGEVKQEIRRIIRTIIRTAGYKAKEVQY